LGWSGGIDLELGRVLLLNVPGLIHSGVNLDRLILGIDMGGVGTGFTFSVLIHYSHILTNYPPHIQRG